MKITKFVAGLVLCIGSFGCKSEASNPLIGSWTSTTDPSGYGAGGCPSHYTFTSNTQTDVTSGHETTIMVSYSVQPNLVFVVMQLGSNGYKFIDHDHVAWSTGTCTYKRD